MVRAVWDPGRNWKVRAEGGKDASKSSKERAEGHRKMRSIRKLKGKDEKLTSSCTNIMEPGVIRNDERKKERYQ